MLASAGTSNARKRLARLAHEAKEACKEVLRDFKLRLQKVVSKIVKDLSDTGLSKDEVWNQLLRGNPSLGREKILKLGGISSYLRYLLVNNLEELMRSSSSYAELTFYKFYKQAVSDPCLGLKLICILLALGHLIFFLSADDQADILGAAIWVSFSLGAFSPFCSLPESCPEEGEPGGGEKPGEDEELTP